MPCSSASFFAAGLSKGASSEADSDFLSVFCSVLLSACLSSDFLSSDFLSSDWSASDAAAPSLTRAINSLLTIVSPDSLTIFSRTPSAGDTTSMTTLSVSISTRSSSRLTASPAFLCQLAIVPSGTDSGSVGALISIDMSVPYTHVCLIVIHQTLILK